MRNLELILSAKFNEWRELLLRRRTCVDERRNFRALAEQHIHVHLKASNGLTNDAPLTRMHEFDQPASRLSAQAATQRA